MGSDRSGSYSRLDLSDRQRYGLRSTMDPRPPPPVGIYLQLYRGAYKDKPGKSKRDQLWAHVDQIKAMGLPGVVFHGFPEELLEQWDGLAAGAQERGLLALASWGLDTKTSTMSAVRKGELVGKLLARPTCAAGLLDAEGQWDSDLGPADDMDEAGAVAFCDALLSEAPAAWVGDQPWYAIDSHGNVRKTAKREREGGVFSGFPVDEFARVCNWGRYRQAYVHPSLGTTYKGVFDRMDREWATVNPALEAAGLGRPLRVTAQGYFWKLHQKVHMLLDRHVRADDPIIIWAEPFPDDISIRGIRIVEWLKTNGMAKVGCDPMETIKKLQTELNTRGHRLDVDGWCGNATAAALGL